MADKVLCVRPSCFGHNEDTASTNSFQLGAGDVATNHQSLAVAEFDEMVATLRAKGIEVVVAQDKSAGTGQETPDSIFPNNWFSTHRLGGQDLLVLYPMCGRNRRLERSGDALHLVMARSPQARILDMTDYEAEGKFLEGTGSMVFDHDSKKCYATISPRTNLELVRKLCTEINYELVAFTSKRSCNQEAVYHTNVILSVGSDWVIACLDVISDKCERASVRSNIERSGKKLIQITEDQVNNFCGNVLCVQAHNPDRRVTVMSKTAHDAFTPEQLEVIRECAVVTIPTIERIGGGSARCTLAELFF